MAQRQMYTHGLDYIKGWPSIDANDQSAYLSPNVTVDPVWPGMVVHLNAEEMFELGAVGNQIAIFLHNGTLDLDVNNSNAPDWYPIGPTGVLSGLVGTGQFELETTEFYKASGVNYVPGDALHAPDEAQDVSSDNSKAGKLFKTTAYAASDVAFTAGTQNICAIVSARDYVNHHGVPVVRFNTAYIRGSA